MSYDGWVKAADKEMKEVYGMTLTSDSGASEDDCQRYYRGAQESKETISEFVKWFGEKYGLDPINTGW